MATGKPFSIPSIDTYIVPFPTYFASFLTAGNINPRCIKYE